MAEAISSFASQERACLIMDRNYLGIEAAKKHFGITPNPDQIAAFQEVPFSEETLRERKNTHILVAVFPLSIMDIKGLVNDGIFNQQGWYDKQTFAKETGEARWCLIRKNEAPHSTSKNWQEQLALLTENEEVPTAQQMVYTTILHCLVTGERLFPEIYVRTSSLDSGGDRVLLGCFVDKGLYLLNDWDGDRRVSLAVSSARKPEN